MNYNKSVVWRNIDKRQHYEIASYIWNLIKNIDDPKIIGEHIKEYLVNSCMSIHLSKHYQYYFMDDPKDAYMFGLFGKWYISLVIYH